MPDATRWGSQPGMKRVGANADSPGRLVPAGSADGSSAREDRPEDVLDLEDADTETSESGLALTYEEVPWERPPGYTPMSRRDRAARPTYRAAVPPTIAPMRFDIEPETASAAGDAHAEIARFDAELDTLIPDAEFAPLASVLLRTESASSSQIENITSGARSLALAEIGIHKYGSNAALVASNVAAMHAALDEAAEVTPETILRVHAALMAGQDYADPGRLREQQVWIGASSSPHNATFVPPAHPRVPAAIDDLCAFVERTDVPLLTQAAIAHAQFETIHPFNDGNGRTGRALVHIMLRNGGATRRATVPVSAGLLRDTDSYFAALDAYRAGDPNPIVERFADASFAAVRIGRVLSADLKQVYEDWQERLRGMRRSSIHRALPLLLSQPAVNSKVLQQRLDLTQPAADSLLYRLADLGIVKKASGVQRNTAWVAADVTSALDAFAERARRRVV